MKKCNEYNKTNSSRMRKATPPWLTEAHKFAIQKIYELRDLLFKETGIEHHVDHIVPLKGKNVCGLHVPWNLQVIPATENLQKGNALLGDYHFNHI